MNDDFNMKSKYFKSIDKENDFIIKKKMIKESLKPSYLRITKSPLAKKTIYPSKNKKKSQNNISVNLNYSLNITLDKLPGKTYKNSKNFETIETSFKDNIQTDNYLSSKSTILERNSTVLSDSNNSQYSNGNKLNKKDNNNFISFNEEFTTEKKEEIIKKIKKSKEDFSNECNIIDNIFYDSPSENGTNIIQLMANKLIKNTIFSKYLNNNSINNKIQNENIRNKKYKNLIEKVKIKNIGIFPDNLFYNYNNINQLINDDNDIIFPYSFIKKSLFRNFMKKIKKGINKNDKTFHHSLTKNRIIIPRNYLQEYFSVTPKKKKNKFLSISKYVSEQNSLERIKSIKSSLRNQINETDWDNYSDIYEPLPTARGPYKGRKISNHNKMNLSDLNINTNDSNIKNIIKKTHLKTKSVAISPKKLKTEKQKLNMSIINNNNGRSFIQQNNYTSYNNTKDIKKRNKMNKNMEKYYTYYDKDFKDNINNHNQNNSVGPIDLRCLFIKSPNEIIKIIKNFFKQNDFFLNIKGNQIKCIQANTHIELNIVKLPYFNNGYYLKIKLKNWVNSQNIINDLLNMLNN